MAVVTRHDFAVGIVSGVVATGACINVWPSPANRHFVTNLPRSNDLIGSLSRQEMEYGVDSL